jgi:hypothetical protein
MNFEILFYYSNCIKSYFGTISIMVQSIRFTWARGSVVGWGNYVTNWKVVGSIPDEVIGCFNLPNPSSHTMAPGVDSTSNRNE